jgi:hypothetical protein
MPEQESPSWSWNCTWRDSFKRQKHDQKADTAAVQHDSSCLKSQTGSMHSQKKTGAGPDASSMLRRWISTNINEEPWTAESRQRGFVLGQRYVQALFLERKIVLTKSAPNWRREQTGCFAITIQHRNSKHWKTPVRGRITRQGVLLMRSARRTEEQSLWQEVITSTTRRKRSLLN